MKIGIITYWMSKSNYGQYLQMYALQEYLRKQGHSPFLIRYKEKTLVDPSFKWSRLITYIAKFPQYVLWYIKMKKHKKKLAKYALKEAQTNRHFSEFMNAHINVSECIYTEEQLISAPPNAEVYICGSDQIWGGRWTYYLDFAPNEKTKIAYAPSLGGIERFEPEYEKQMKKLLSRLDFIGMREQSGVSVCHRLGRTDAIKVCDPTLLLSQDDYEKICIRPQRTKPYVLVYVLKNTMSCSLQEIWTYIKRLGYDMVLVNNTNEGNEYEQIYPCIEEWLGMIAESQLVITNSFHATVFSLIFERPFVAVPLSGIYSRMNNRIEELLKDVGLTECMYNGSFKTKIPILDFSEFKEYRLREELKSRKYLSKYIPFY